MTAHRQISCRCFLYIYLPQSVHGWHFHSALLMWDKLGPSTLILHLNSAKSSATSARPTTLLQVFAPFPSVPTWILGLWWNQGCNYCHSVVCNILIYVIAWVATECYSCLFKLLSFPVAHVFHSNLYGLSKYCIMPRGFAKWAHKANVLVPAAALIVRSDQICRSVLLFPA